MSGSDWGLFLGGVAAVITALAGFLVAVFPMLREIRTHARQINRAVNQVDPGEPPLVERVCRLEHKVNEVRSHLKTLTVQPGGQRSTDPPPASD